MSKKLKKVVITLDEPIELDAAGNVIDDADDETEIAETIGELTFRRCRARHTLAAEDIEDEALAGFAIFAAMADVPVDVIGNLALDDFMQVSEKVSPLMGKTGAAALDALKTKTASSPSTGETS